MMVFDSISGKKSMGSRVSENTPKIAKARKIRKVVTGLLTADRKILIRGPPYWLITSTLEPSFRPPRPFTTTVCPSLIPERTS